MKKLGQLIFAVFFLTIVTMFVFNVASTSLTKEYRDIPYTATCIDGVEYMVFGNSMSAKFGPNGLVVTCGRGEILDE